MKQRTDRRGARWLSVAALAVGATVGVQCEATGAASPVVVSGKGIEFQLDPDASRFEVVDRDGLVRWGSNPGVARLGQATIVRGGQRQTVDLKGGQVERTRNGLRVTIRPLAGEPAATLGVEVRMLEDGRGLEFGWGTGGGLEIESVRLLDGGLWVSGPEEGYLVMPVREGLLIPADSGRAFTNRFDTYAYEGCHMAMFGLVKRGAAALVTWSDPYVAVEVQSELGQPMAGGQVLLPSLVLRKTARAFQVRFLGRGDYGTIARAYRAVARERGWMVPWSEKLEANPDRARLFGAINFKLWSALDRQMNEESTRETKVQLNWTFEEAAEVAEHLKRDLGLDRVLFLMGGWIRRGYDNQHPDILPAAPECGGDARLAECARRVAALGYVFGLHDNYQDMYRDAPSWDEAYLTRNADGSLAKGGVWAGGRAYLTCSRKALELAKREVNLPAVRRLTGAPAYFIDTTYAAGLMECFDPRHPLTRAEDRHWKQALSDYARGVFGIFGSECGREWALPHSDFFEGLTGVSGQAYHNAELLPRTGGVVVPLFEMVYRDGIAMYGKYGYAPGQAASYVLQHLVYGRPLNYHAVPPHRYWEGAGAAPPALGIRPCRPELDMLAPREAHFSFQWQVEQTPAEDWQVFVHFTDAEGKIYFQADHAPRLAASRWRPGRVESRGLTLGLPDRLRGTLDVRVGLWQPESGRRARLTGADDGEGRYVVARLRLGDNGAELLDPKPSGFGEADAGVFARGVGGWGEGHHALDCFVKNTYEILSPLHELTAQAGLERHEFVTRDRSVQRSVFGSGRDQIEVVVNAGSAEHTVKSRFGGAVVLGRYGFLIEGRTFVAFHAREWNGLRYDRPTLFTVRSATAKALGSGVAARVFHGFGDARLRWGGSLLEVEKERVVGSLGR